jgi:hypothetical protein
MKRLIPALLLAAAASGCAGARVKQDYDTSVDFSRLKTYVWQASGPGGAPPDPAGNSLMDERVRNAVETALAQKGYQKAAGRADFTVLSRYESQNEAEPDRVRTGVGVGVGSGGTFGGISLGVGSGGQSELAVLTIDVTDPKDGRLLWRGSTSRSFSGDQDPRKTTARVNEMAKEVLAVFPPGARRK